MGLGAKPPENLWSHAFLNQENVLFDENRAVSKRRFSSIAEKGRVPDPQDLRAFKRVLAYEQFNGPWTKFDLVTLRTGSLHVVFFNI